MKKFCLRENFLSWKQKMSVSAGIKLSIVSNGSGRKVLQGPGNTYWEQTRKKQ
jgi:hypothetical protein